MKTISDILERMLLLHNFLIKMNYRIIVAESCTGGFLSYIFTYFSGSSNYFDKSFIVYNDDAKIQILDVNANLLKQFTAVSYEVCEDMVHKINEKYHADIIISVTGYLDFYNSQVNKGLVYFGIKFPDNSVAITEKHYSYNRNDNRTNAVYDIISDLCDKFNLNN